MARLPTECAFCYEPIPDIEQLRPRESVTDLPEKMMTITRSYIRCPSCYDEIAFRIQLHPICMERLEHRTETDFEPRREDGVINEEVAGRIERAERVSDVCSFIATSGLLIASVQLLSSLAAVLRGMPRERGMAGLVERQNISREHAGYRDAETPPIRGKSFVHFPPTDANARRRPNTPRALRQERAQPEGRANSSPHEGSAADYNSVEDTVSAADIICQQSPQSEDNRERDPEHGANRSQLEDNGAVSHESSAANYNGVEDIVPATATGCEQLEAYRALLREAVQSEESGESSHEHRADGSRLDDEGSAADYESAKETVPAADYESAEETVPAANYEQPGSHRASSQERARPHDNGKDSEKRASSSRPRPVITLHDPIVGDTRPRGNLNLGLAPVILPLSNEIGVDKIRAAQQEFFHKISVMRVSHRQLDADAAAKVTNFFFRDCMGTQVLDRLWWLSEIHKYQPDLFRSRYTPPEAGPVLDDDMPARLRRLVIALLAVAGSDAPRPMCVVSETLGQCDLITECNELVDEMVVSGDKSENAKYLIGKGYQPSGRRGWTLIIREYLGNVLGLRRVQVNNHFHISMAWGDVARIFGRGMVLLVGVKAYVTIPLAGCVC